MIHLHHSKHSLGIVSCSLLIIGMLVAAIMLSGNMLDENPGLHTAVVRIFTVVTFGAVLVLAGVSFTHLYGADDPEVNKTRGTRL